MKGKNDIVKINELNNRQIELVYLSDYETEMIKVVDDWEKKLAGLL